AQANDKRAGWGTSKDNIYYERHLFTSLSDFMGLVPKVTQIGDMICFISSARVPFVVRPQVPSTTDVENVGVPVYTLIGECYVFGLMHGELVEGMNASL